MDLEQSDAASSWRAAGRPEVSQDLPQEVAPAVSGAFDRSVAPDFSFSHYFIPSL